MKATEVMLCWNPGTDQVALVRWPDEHGRSDRYRCSGLACYSVVHEMTECERQAYVFAAVLALIVRDKCDTDAVYSAVSQLDECRNAEWLHNLVVGCIDPDLSAYRAACGTAPRSNTK